MDANLAFFVKRHGFLLSGRAEKRSAFRLELRHILAIPDYRRNRIAGGTFFFTVNLLDRGSDLLVRRIDLLRDAVRRVRARTPFHIDAWVVLPDHLHCLWTLPEGDWDYPARWRAIKIAFVKALPAVEPRSSIMSRRRERGIWQRRYWEHTIRDDWDFAAHMDYVHFNPVKHGFVEHPAEWPYSSFRRCVERGFYPRGGAAEVTSRNKPESGLDLVARSRRADEQSVIRRSMAEGAALFRPTLAGVDYSPVPR